MFVGREVNPAAACSEVRTRGPEHHAIHPKQLLEGKGPRSRRQPVRRTGRALLTSRNYGIFCSRQDEHTWNIHQLPETHAWEAGVTTAKDRHVLNIDLVAIFVSSRVASQDKSICRTHWSTPIYPVSHLRRSNRRELVALDYQTQTAMYASRSTDTLQAARSRANHGMVLSNHQRTRVTSVVNDGKHACMNAWWNLSWSK